MDSEEFLTGATFEEVVAEIEAHEASYLFHAERNSVNGYITFRFRDEDGELKSKMTFDSVSDDMAIRAAAVLDALSNPDNLDLDEARIQQIFDADIAAEHTPR